MKRVIEIRDPDALRYAADMASDARVAARMKDCATVWRMAIRRPDAFDVNAAYGRVWVEMDAGRGTRKAAVYRAGDAIETECLGKINYNRALDWWREETEAQAK